MKLYSVKGGNALTNYFSVLEAKFKDKIYLRRKCFYYVRENVPQPLGRTDDPEFMFEWSPYYIEVDDLNEVKRVQCNFPTLQTALQDMYRIADETARGTICLYARAGVQADHDVIVSRINLQLWHCGKAQKTVREQMKNVVK